MATLIREMPSRCRCGAPLAFTDRGPWCGGCGYVRLFDGDKHPRAANGQFGTGSGTSTVKTTSSGPVSAQAHATINAALALLPDDMAKKIKKVHLVANPDPKRADNLRHLSPETEGLTQPGDDEVTIPVDTNVFLDAEKGNQTALTKLASVLVHEQAHVDNGQEEKQAYDAQLEALAAMNAPKSLIKAVSRARASVTGEK